VLFLWPSFRFLRAPGEANARRVLLASLVYLPGLLSLIALGCESGESGTGDEPRSEPAARAGRSRPAARPHRRVLSVLLVLVVLLALFTFGYVWFYGRVLRDPEVPPSVLANNRACATSRSCWSGRPSSCSASG